MNIGMGVAQPKYRHVTDIVVFMSESPSNHPRCWNFMIEILGALS